MTKAQTTTYKTLHGKLKIELYESGEVRCIKVTVDNDKYINMHYLKKNHLKLNT